MLNVGGGELLIILLVALIFLGPERLPGVARQVGQTVSSLRSLASGFQEEIAAAAKSEVDADTSTTDSSMTLTGPTSQSDAIAATQTDPFAGKQTNPSAIRDAARDVEYDDDDGAEKAQSAGGPTDLRDADLTEIDLRDTNLRDEEE